MDKTGMLKNLKRLLPYYRPYKGLFFLDFFCAVAAALLELLFPFTVSRVVDDLLPTGNWSVILFGGTIRENIQFGKLDATEREIWEAARRAKLDEFIREQPNELDTVIGERGVKLSGGQKQRLSIARMFLKNPPILILDEATSSLDTETEAAIQHSLAELAKGRTTLLIAHRLATMRNADRIVVLTEEGIAEQGGHHELLQRGGIYSRLHRAQAGA
jgi:ATP-binding cassette subfamily B protein